MKPMRVLDARREAKRWNHVLEDAPALETRGHYAGSTAGNQSLGLTLTIAIHALVALALLAKWGHDRYRVVETEPPMTTFDITAAPPEPMHEVPEGPEQVERKEQRPEKQEQPVVELPPPALPPMATVAAPPKQKPVVTAAEAVPETTAPKSLPAPPAPRLANNAEASWNSLLLAHLEKFRRYPSRARARRAQGVVTVRFSITREGRLVSATIVRSSGSIDLDQAALATVHRAAPFPKPPPEMAGDPVELVVPVEFFLSGKAF